jgi:hypothetical protein
MIFKIIAFVAAAVPIFLFVRSIFFRRPTRLKEGFKEFKKQSDLAVSIFLFLIGCVVIFAAGKLVWAWLWMRASLARSDATAHLLLSPPRWHGPLCRETKGPDRSNPQRNWADLLRIAIHRLSIRENSALGIGGCRTHNSPMDKSHYERADYSVVVKNRAPPPKAWRWEIYRAGNANPIKQSSIYFDTTAAARRAGKDALKELLNKLFN